MKKIVLPLIALGLITNLSLGATGHIDGCPNTGYDTSCCTKKYKIEAKPGYKVTDVLVNGESKGVIPEYTFTDITGPQKLEVKTELLTYQISFDANTGVGEPAAQTKTYGKDLILSSIKPTKEGYTFLGWNTDKNATAPIYKAGGTYSVEGDQTLYAIYKSGVIKELTTTPNAPVVVGTGLTPVNWDKTKGEWVKTTPDNWIYDYSFASENNGTIEGDGTAMWANAIMEDGSMYVWIPRFSYYTDTVNTYILFSDGLDDYIRDPSGETEYWYRPHSAFNVYSGSNIREGNNISGGLRGFWVAKYLGSRLDATETVRGENEKELKFVPNKIFSYCKSSESADDYNRYFYRNILNNDLRKHLIMNSEWGAITYLTNTIGKLPLKINGYITGKDWDTVDGVKYSTTHNIYGIYDMVSVYGECVATYTEGTGGEFKDYRGVTEYVDILSSDSSKYWLETLDYAPYWDGTWKGEFPNDSYPELFRGAGDIKMSNRNGVASNVGARAVISPIEENYSTHTVVYDSNGGSEIDNTETLGHLGVHTVISEEPTKDGYILAGWSEDKDVIFPEYVAGDEIFVAKDITLYAIWASTEVTNYTQEDIDNSNRTMESVGTTNLYAIARKIGDTVVITKNTEKSDVTMSQGFSGSYTGFECSKLIITGVSNIGQYRFNYNKSLEEVYISNTVTSIGKYAFGYCSNLTDIYYDGTIEQWNAISFGSSWKSNTNGLVVHCTDGDI